MADEVDRTRRTYSQAQRVLKIYAALANAPGGLTILDLETRTGVTRRTLNRDLGVLQEDYLVDAVSVDAAGRKRWGLLPAGPSSTVSFTRGELAALHLGRSMLAFLERTDLGGSMGSALDKVTSRLGNNDLDLSRKLYALPDAPPVEASTERFDDVLNAALSAVMREQKLRIAYPVGSANEVVSFVVDPLTIAYFRSRLYLVAVSERHGGVYPFALHRVEDADWLRGEAATIPADYHPEAHFSVSFGIFAGGSPTRVRVRFSQAAARYARERRWHASQEIVDLGDGGCEIGWYLPPTPDLISWLLSFGAEVEVLEPATLRTAVQQRLTKALQQYDGGASC